MGSKTVVVAAAGYSPGKSLAFQALEAARLTSTGIIGDRNFAVVHAGTGVNYTQRTVPRMALVRARYLDQWRPEEGVQLLIDGADPFTLYPDLGLPSRKVKIIHTWCHGIDQGDAVARWITRSLITDKLGRPVDCRIVWLPPNNNRLVQEPFAPDGQVITFVDGFPLLVTSRESYLDVCDRAGYKFHEARFRPNVVISGLEPWQEDMVLEAYIPARRVKLIFEKLNGRCEVINVNPVNGDAIGHNLLELLAGFRTMKEPTTEKPGVMFGVNVRALFEGPEAEIHVGDEVVVTRWREQRP